MTKQNTAVLGSELRNLPAESGSTTMALNPQPVFAKSCTQAAWLPKTSARIAALADLNENWDSYGGHAISGSSITAARHLIDHLAWFIGVQAPAVSGTPDGGVGFSWDDGDWSLDAEIVSSGRIKYVYLDEEDSSNDLEATTVDGNELLELLARWR